MDNDTSAATAALSEGRRHCRAALALGDGGAERLLSAAVEAQGGAKHKSERIRGHLRALMAATGCSAPGMDAASQLLTFPESMSFELLATVVHIDFCVDLLDETPEVAMDGLRSTSSIQESRCTTLAG